MKKKINKKQRIINTETMIAAIDVGKDKNWAIFRNPAGDDSRPFAFTNSREGFEKFYSQINWFKGIYKTKDVVVGFEPTGVYGEPLAHYLHSKGTKLVIVNPFHGKRIKEIRDNSPEKTDQKDPRVIADLIQLNCILSLIIPKGDSAELRHLSHARERAISLRSCVLNQLHGLVFKIFPEFQKIIKSLESKTAQYLLQHYPTPEDVCNADIEALICTIRKISRGQIKRSKVEELYEVASVSVGIKEGRDSIVKEIKYLVNTVQSQNVNIKNIEKDISEILQRIPMGRRFLSIKGIGEITVAGILGEVAGFENIHDSREVEKLAGLNLFEISSGIHQGNKRISKRGRSLLRKLLYFAALNVIKHEGVFRDKYQGYLEIGKPKKQALIAIARKLVRVIFALVQNDVNFDVNYYQNQSSSKAA